MWSFPRSHTDAGKGRWRAARHPLALQLVAKGREWIRDVCKGLIQHRARQSPLLRTSGTVTAPLYLTLVPWN
ncbi:hypothetical protein E2C01_034189 [Portunus trituberculatus]|uniref:Uncharacterized protein n=1 Tax=Portunus trituberculatus TaxID=210409 RepID=A0A5B7F5H7_PORTR|nr:hypothetical protein [Portunus trituberculatus]